MAILDEKTRQELRNWLNRLVRNAGSLLLSLILALIVWVIAVQQQNPIQRADIDRVPVLTRNLPAGLVVFSLSRETVQVAYQATRRTVDSITPESFIAALDLAGLGPGTYDVPVDVSHPEPDVRIISVTPTRVRVRLEEVKTKELPIRVDVMDSAPFGYEYGVPVITPTTTVISGPAPFVDAVATAVVEVYIRDSRQTIQRQQAISLRDATGSPAGFVDMSPSVVQVTVPIVQRAGFKDLPVVVRSVGNPAPGYRISSITSNPVSVTLFGAPDILASLPGAVETLPVSIEGAQAEVVERVALNLPEGVSVAFGEQAVQVRIGIVPIESSLTVTRAPVIQGLAPNYVARVLPTTVEVLISGPLPRLDALKDADVRVVIDLTNLGPGTHTITPNVILPEGLQQQSLLPGTVQVEITELTPTPTPTPETSPTPSGTATAQVTPVAGVRPTQSAAGSDMQASATRPVPADLTPAATPPDTPTPTPTGTATPTAPPLPTEGSEPMPETSV